MILSCLMVMLGESDAEAAGRAVGSILIPSLILLYGVSKCHIISKRPSANRKCALSLMLALIALFLSVLLGALSKTLSLSVGSQVFRVLLLLGILVLSVVTLVLAVLGLGEYSKEKGRYMQGRSQAGWALVISILMMAMVCIGLVRSFVNQSSAGDVKTIGATPGKIVANEDLNFRFYSPKRPWTQVDLSKINKDSNLSFMRHSPEAYVMIIAEKLGADSQIDNDQLSELSAARMKSVSSSMRVIQKTPYRINNLDGILVKRQVEMANYDFFYTQWYMVTNGFAYQLTAYCRTSDRPQLEDELLQAISGFNQIDPNRVAESNKQKYETNYISPSHFFTVNVAHSVWHTFPSLKDNLAEAEFGGSRGDSCFVVVPVWLGHEKPDADALASGLLATMSIVDSDDKLTQRQTYTNNAAEGLQFDYQRTVKGTLYRYRFRVIRQGEFGYLLAAWTVRNNGIDEILDDALERIKITAPVEFTVKSPVDFSPQDLKTQAEVNNQIGLHYYNANEYGRALPFFTKAAEIDDDTTYIGNVLLTLTQLNRSQEGLDYLKRIPVELLKKPDILVYQAYFQSKCSLTANAITNYAEVFSQGYRSDSDFVDYIDLLITTSQYDRALTEVNRYLAAGDSMTVRLEIGEIYRAMPDYEKAVNFLKDVHQKAPYNAKITRRLIRTLLDAGKPNEALELCKELLKDDSRSFVAYYLKGQSEMNLKWYRDAKLSLEAAAKLEPSDEDVQNDLNYVNGLLGEGNNSMLKTPIDPVPLPAGLTNLALTAPSTNFSRNYGCYYEDCIKAISYASNADYKVTDYMTIRVLDSTGVAAFSSFQLLFDPLSEEIYVNDARVSDSTGKLLATVNPSDCYVIDNPMDKNASSGKVLNLPLAGLQPGCRISLAITRRSSGKLEQFPFLSQTLAKSYPVIRSGVYLRGNLDGLIIHFSPDVNRESLSGGVFLSVTNPMVAKWEPLQIPGKAYLPVVWVADGSWSWARLATNYLARINVPLQPDESVQLKAKQLVSGCSNDIAKVTALSRYVQTNCVYKAIEFGRHSQIPAQAADTLRKAYGDCKDLAMLLQQMLQSVGIAANLALISSEEPVRVDLPSLDQFDHMIVAIKTKDGEKFVDCTSKGANLADFLPVGLGGHQSFVLDGTNSHFTQLPDYPQGDSHIHVQLLARILTGGDVSVDETASFTGSIGSYLREYLQSIPLALRQESLQRDMGISDAVITNLEVIALNDPTHPLQVKYTFSSKDQFHQTPNGMAGKLRVGLVRYYLEPTLVERRLSPFEFTVPMELDGEISFVLPKGYDVVSKTNSITKINSRFLTFESHQVQEKDRLNFYIHYLRPVGRYGAVDYSSYQETETEILSAIYPDLLLMKN